MDAGGQEEGDEGGGGAGELEGADGAVVGEAEEEVVDGSAMGMRVSGLCMCSICLLANSPVPVAGELVPARGVPPVGVEAAIREQREFGEDVQHALPDDIP